MGYIKANGALLVYSVNAGGYVLVGNLQHNALWGYEFDRHIDWTVDNGATDIHAFNISEFAVTQHQAAINHDALLNAAGLANDHTAIDAHIADGTLHYTEGSIDHTAILNIGTNTHAQIDTHIALIDEHFPTEAGSANYVALYKSDGAAIVADTAAKFYLDANDVLHKGTDLDEYAIGEVFSASPFVLAIGSTAARKHSAFLQFSDDADAHTLAFVKSRGIETAITAAQTGDILGTVNFSGYNGIFGVADGTVSSFIQGKLVTAATFGGRTGMDFYVANGGTTVKAMSMESINNGAETARTTFIGEVLLDSIQFTKMFFENINAYDTTTSPTVPLQERAVAHNNNAASQCELSTHVGSLETVFDTGYQHVVLSYSSAPDLNVDITPSGITAGVAEVNGVDTVVKGVYLNEPYQTAIMTKLTNVTDDGIDRYHISKTPGNFDTSLQTASFTIDNSMGNIEIAAASDTTITLPTASARNDHRQWTITRTDSTSNTVTFSGTISGIVNPSMPFQWDSVTIVSNSTGFIFK